MIKEFVKTIKDKKSLKNLDDGFVEELVLDYLDKHPKLKKKMVEHPKVLKSKEFDILLKEIRKKLHEVYGIFNLGNPNLDGLKGKGDIVEEHKKLLMKHKSSNTLSWNTDNS